MKILKQEDKKDCGLYVLNSLINYFYNKEVDINYLKINASYSSDGISLHNLRTLALENGVILESFSGDFDSLYSLKNDDLPIILLLNRNGYTHYVILNKIKNNYFWLLDSQTGELEKVNALKLKEEFAEVVIFPKKSNLKLNAEKITIDNKIKSLISIKKLVWPLLLSALVNLLLNFSSSFFVKVVFDFIIPNFLIKTLIVIFILFLWLAFLQCINKYFKNYLVRKITNQIYLELSSNFFEKIKQTPVDHLTKLNNSEYFKRASYISYISEYQANFAYTFLGEIASIVLSAFLLIWINYLLFIYVGSITLVLLLSNIIFHNKLENKHIRNIKVTSNKIESELDFINGKDNYGDQKYSNFLTFLLKKNTLKQREADENIFFMQQNNNLLNSTLISSISNVIIFISTFLIIRNKLSSGDMMMFLTSVSFFINPIMSISSLLSSNMLMKKYVDQVNFVFNLPNIQNFEKGVIINGLIKNIKLKKINFSYEEGHEILNISELEINDHVRINGTNGCGKSSFAKFLRGDFLNYTGEYLINDINVNQLNFNNLKEKICYVGSNFYIPNSKVIDFITNNSKTLLDNLNNNLVYYEIFDYLEKVKVNLNSFVNNNGGNLSSGQKQIVLLLRLFCQKYKIIILDEAFENIDKETMKFLMNCIKNYQDEALFIEISHSRKYIQNSKEINFNEINKNF
ncbi:Mbov_0121 family peptidase domain-containing ABC transporter [Mycoplasma tauri]|uniref:Mbov_0121 family peptidase domain-containing ABC transporter n=1 Tax=Mycoplasma tauri TaxID=547987 RepID=UPI001CBBF416|nr:cysteine peptidase family C39 domain-containing protein [Mycoplasma tauri]MBZ4218344.1 ATP-binding cassette domain-containing protein [Mycoplasma tauri]